MIITIFAAALAGSTFTCTVTRVHDGDGPLWCAEGPKVRIAGVQAPDFRSAEPCRQRRAGYVCSDARARKSQRTVSALVLRRRLTCQALEPSYNRIVARCRLPDGATYLARCWPPALRRAGTGTGTATTSGPAEPAAPCFR